jgi:hypothetical protein
MVRPQVSDGGWLLIRRVAANILNNQSQTADMRWSSSLEFGRGANKSSPSKLVMLPNTVQGIGLGWMGNMDRIDLAVDTDRLRAVWNR